MRDKRFVAAHRGGPLETRQHRALMAWGRNCAKHVLPLMPDELDQRLIDAIAVSRRWEAGEVQTGVAQKASVAAHAAAREYRSGVSVAIARSIAQAAATAHFADHCLVAAFYALKAAKLGEVSAELERAWQDDQLGADIRDLVLQNRGTRENSIA
ncbi:putative immunity protein [Nitratireductor thuwali]|uniref:putative immunity protein n=1 Tax=Nitratireductor thuwali TaxID=2267699 RepID=UPI0030CD17E0